MSLINQTLQKKKIRKPQEEENIMSGFAAPATTIPGQQAINSDPKQVIGQITPPTDTTIPTGPTGPIGPGPDQPSIDGSTEEYLNKLKEQGYFDGGDILDMLPPEMKEQILSNIYGMSSGQFFDPYKTQSQEAFARAAQQLRGRAGGMLSGQLGQGAAVKGMQATEGDIMAGLSDKMLADQIAKGEMQMTGTQMGLGLAESNVAQQNFLKSLEKSYVDLSSQEKQLLAKLDVEQSMHMEGLQKQLEMLGMQIASEEKMFKDKVWLQQQNIDLDKAKLYGYEDENGNHVMGLLEMQHLQFQSGMNSQAGLDFSSYINANLQSGIDDPALHNLGQKLWESYGNTGDVPDWWLEQRIAAVKDPNLTNPIIITENMFKQALENGTITQEQYDEFMQFFTDFITNPGGDDDTDLTPKQKYEEFMALHVPDEYQDQFTYDVWVAAGRPTSWEDYTGSNDFSNYGDIAIFENGVGKVQMDIDDINRIIQGIEDNDPIAKSKYLLPEDSELSELVNNPKDFSGDVTAEMKTLANDSVGKLIKLSGGEYGVVLGGTFYDGPEGRGVYLVYIDPKTGNQKEKKFAY